MKINKEIILASKSPRRSQLLSEAGFEFEVQTKEVNEDFPADMATSEVAKYIAKKKANAFESNISNNHVVITADTIVVCENVIYGKPKDRLDAINTLQILSNKVHQVITGVCLFSLEKEILFDSVSHVHLTELNDTEIEYYVDKFEPYDKAGSYAIQEWIGLCKISKIEGTYSNIVGLPVDLVYRNLIEHF